MNRYELELKTLSLTLGVNKIKVEHSSTDSRFIDAVLRFFDTTMDILKSKDRKRENCSARFILYEYYASTRMTYENIGKKFNRDHSTISHGIKKLKNLRSIGDPIILDCEIGIEAVYSEIKSNDLM